MTQITVDFEPELLGSLRLAPQELGEEMKIAAAIQWYNQGKVSQEKAAQLAGLSRFEFLDELHHRKVPACQVTKAELEEEIYGQ